jgi:hypothetical protein
MPSTTETARLRTNERLKLSAASLDRISTLLVGYGASTSYLHWEYPHGLATFLTSQTANGGLFLTAGLVVHFIARHLLGYMR